MKTEIEQLIDRLADKTLGFGCRVLWKSARNAKSYKCSVVRTWMDKLVITKGQKGTLSVPVGSVRVLGHPIRIGDVLQKMLESYEDGIEGIFLRDGWGIDVGNYSVAKILRFWGSIGFTKSLQKIYAECEWVQVFYSSKNCGIEKEKDGECTCGKFQPKQKAHRELFEFLLSLHL